MRISNHVLEADIAGELYYQLRGYGIVPRLELKLPSALHRSGKMRVDMAIVIDKTLRAVIECKNPGTKAGKAWYKRQSFSKFKIDRQISAYEQFEKVHGIPVFWCRSMTDIKPTVGKILAVLETQ